MKGHALPLSAVLKQLCVLARPPCCKVRQLLARDRPDCGAEHVEQQLPLLAVCSEVVCGGAEGDFHLRQGHLHMCRPSAGNRVCRVGQR